MADKPAKSKAKVVDKWKAKSWYTLVAPEMLDSREMGQLVSSDEANLMDRKVKIGLGDMLDSFSQATAYTSMHFRVKEVKGKSAHCIFIGHELVPGYVRTLARRRRSVMNQVDDVVTKDGVGVRVKIICVSGLRVSEGVRADVRKGISEAVKALASQMDYATLVQEMVFGKLSAKIYAHVKRMGPIKRVEVRKSELRESFEKRRQAA
jgi:small subunit ribosomal protein S3Ae